MKVLKNTNEVILEPAEPAHSAVIWLHGLGADGNDFVPLVPALDLPRDAAIRFIFPHAPMRPVTLNGGMPIRARSSAVDRSEERRVGQECVSQCRSRWARYL